MHHSRRSTHPRRPRARWWSVGLMAGAVAVGASGCGASTQTLADGGGSDVGYSGRLALIGGNCVGLGSPDDEETTVLAFPHGTRTSDDGRSIVLPDGLEVALGDAISAGGGSTTLSLYPDAFKEWPDAPSGCAGATYLTTIHEVSLDEEPQG